MYKCLWFIIVCISSLYSKELPELFNELLTQLSTLSRSLDSFPASITPNIPPSPPAPPLFPTGPSIPTPPPVPGTIPLPGAPTKPIGGGLIPVGQMLSLDEKTKSDQEIIRVLTLLAYQDPVKNILEKTKQRISDLSKSTSFRFYAGKTSENLAQAVQNFIDRTLLFMSDTQLLDILSNFEQGNYQLLVNNIFEPFILSDNKTAFLKDINELYDLIIIKIVASQRKPHIDYALDQEQRSDEIFLKALSMSKGLTIDDTLQKPTAEQARELIIKKLLHLIMHPDYLKFETIIVELPKKKIAIQTGGLLKQLAGIGKGTMPFKSTDTFIALLQEPTGILKLNQLNSNFLEKYLFDPINSLDDIKNALMFPFSGSKIIIQSSVKEYKPLADTIMSLDNKLDILEFLDAYVKKLSTSEETKFMIQYRKYTTPDINTLPGALSNAEKQEISTYISKYQTYDDAQLKNLYLTQQLKGLRDARYKNVVFLINALTPFQVQTLGVSVEPEVSSKLKTRITAVNSKYMQRFYFNMGLYEPKIVGIQDLSIPFNQYMRYLRDSGVLKIDQIEILKNRSVDPKVYYFVKSVEAYNVKS